MKLANQLGIVALSVVLFAAPTMACTLPVAVLTAAERECCEQMAAQCGSAGMPSSHACCQRLASPDCFTFVLPAAQHGFSDLMVVATGSIPMALRVLVPQPAAHISWLDDIHSPPESPPAGRSVLRI